LSAFIVDATVAIKWVVAEQGTTEALALLGNMLLAPSLLRAECANILWKKVRRGEMSTGEAGIAARILASFEVEYCSSEPTLARVLALALALDHPAYDCVYLALAEARGVPLVTADEKLIRVIRTATQSAGVFGRISVVSLLNEPAFN
jgi:predicted nucleic acid-binding protein